MPPLDTPRLPTWAQNMFLFHYDTFCVKSISIGNLQSKEGNLEGYYGEDYKNTLDDF
jgi:hypothetical protein